MADPSVPTPPPMNPAAGNASSGDASKPRNLADVLREFSEHQKKMREELAKVIVGQSDTIEQ
ncbi:MAG: AAA family ATPase, partial [Rhodopirellula bahusiensis]